MIELRKAEAYHPNRSNGLAEPDYIAPLDFVLAYKDPKDGSAMVLSCRDIETDLVQALLKHIEESCRIGERMYEAANRKKI